MQCAIDGCPHRVIRQPETGKWYHVDTHGVPTDHDAVPKKSVEPKDKPARPLEERLEEYRDAQQGIVTQFEELIIIVEAAGGDATALRDGIAFYKPVVEDLTNLLAGNELRTFVVTGTVPKEWLSGD
jgi:hypothetical protein